MLLTACYWCVLLAVWVGWLGVVGCCQVLDMWDQDLDGLVNKLARIPLLNHPGVTWHYSVGIDVLGAVIQRAAQMPLEEFMRTRLFEPLGMKDTGFWVPPSQLHRLVPYWTSAAAPGMLVPIPNSYTGTDFSKEPKLKSGGGGLVSTAHDFLRFGQMLLNKGELDGVRVLKEETVAAYLTNQLPKSLLPFQMGPVVFRSSVRTTTVGLCGWVGGGVVCGPGLAS